MHEALKRLQGKVVVITGASSGIGREAAMQFARLGCKVVLAARRAPDLEQTARLCRAAGGEALVAVTDVTREDDVQRLAAAAMDRWGRIDVWINNAGVTLFARLRDAPIAEHRRVLEVNLFGAMFGARAALPVFQRQGRGVLINVGSVLSKVGQPFVPSYAISKFAVQGLSEVLRAELADAPHIAVCTIFPYTVDTPHFQSGANRIGRHARAMPPVQSASSVARGLVRLAARPRPELYVPAIARAGVWLHRWLPATTDRLLLHSLSRWHFDATREPFTEGNLFTPVEVDRAEVTGQRLPQLGTARFGAWLVADLLRTQATQLRTRWLRGRSTAPRAFAERE